MAETDSEADALARLEAALDRIAQAPRRQAEPPPDGAAPDQAASEVADRLDALILQLRGALAAEA